MARMAKKKKAVPTNGTVHAGSGEPVSRPLEASTSSAATFEAACARIQENSRRQLEKMKDLLPLDDSAEPNEDIEHDAILDKVSKGYVGGKNDTQDMMEVLLAGSITCVICIDNVRHQEATWSCPNCFKILHLHCVNKWARDSLYLSPKPGEDAAVKTTWSCPNCRADHTEVPQHYECFCGKERDPAFDKWLCPHSCGSLCGRALNPACGHRCTLLCHPGPCPACPKTVNATCYCAKSTTTRRCSQKEWSCNAVCGARLRCGQHDCPQRCHAGPCAPCGKESVRACNCGAERKKVRCEEGLWKCQKSCGRQLNCGQHTCQDTCHKAGDCGPCPRSGTRFCPCGQTKHSDLSCTQLTVPTCLNTCEKLLGCGVHRCWERCHEGDCQACVELVTKTCRCGAKSRQLACVKEFTCDTRCSRQKPCGHICNRKCCPPNETCPPCTIVCNRKLHCGNHKCQSLCHRGPCYPCREHKDKTCSCGKTKATFQCGTNMKTARVVCREPCKIAPDCHHSSRPKHNCHEGRCPPCTLACDKRLACGHRCPARCHSAVLTKITPKEKPRGPWEPQPQPYWELVEKPCPLCTVPVQVDCLGGHGVTEWPCHVAKVQSCGRPCGRRLPCGNHTCALQCHEVVGSREPHLAGTNCALDCGQSCPTRGRPKDCPHPCLKHCHSGDCAPCNQYVQFRCHCGNATTVKPCAEWCTLTDDAREVFRSCGQRCSRNLACGHRCHLKCHPGDCASPSTCRKKITVHCACKRIKQEVDCLGGEGKTTTKVPCDDVCRRILGEKQRCDEERNAKLEAQRRREEEEKNAREVERALGERKKRRRKRADEDVEVVKDNNLVAQVAASTLLIVVVAFLIRSWLSSSSSV